MCLELLEKERQLDLPTKFSKRQQIFFPIMSNSKCGSSIDSVKCILRRKTTWKAILRCHLNRSLIRDKTLRPLSRDTHLLLKKVTRKSHRSLFLNRGNTHLHLSRDIHYLHKATRNPLSLINKGPLCLIKV